MDNVHTLPLGAPEGVTKFLNGSSEALVNPGFEGLARSWATRWENSAWFQPNAWRNRDRWVRFHYLPGSRESPRNERDDREIRTRFEAILDAVCDGEPSVTVAVESYSWQNRAPRRPTLPEPGTRRILPSAAWLGVVRDLEDNEVGWNHVWISSVGLDSPTVVALFDAVTAQNERPIFFTDNCRRIFRPYLGGVDVLLESTAARDALIARFPDWLSPRQEWIPSDDEAPL